METVAFTMECFAYQIYQYMLFILKIKKVFFRNRVDG